MSDSYKICRRCGARVPPDPGRTCPSCGEEATFDHVMPAVGGRYGITGQPATLKRIAE